jgi:hypothetical protein
MIKPIKFALVGGLVVSFVFLTPTLYVCYDDYSIRQQGEVIARKIDAYESREGHVPDSLEDIGERSNRLRYHASDAHRYALRYMDWAGATYVFDSEARKWNFRR